MTIFLHPLILSASYDRVMVHKRYTHSHITRKLRCLPRSGSHTAKQSRHVTACETFFSSIFFLLAVHETSKLETRWIDPKGGDAGGRAAAYGWPLRALDPEPMTQAAGRAWVAWVVFAVRLCVVPRLSLFDSQQS